MYAQHYSKETLLHCFQHFIFLLDLVTHSLCFGCFTNVGLATWATNDHINWKWFRGFNNVTSFVVGLITSLLNNSPELQISAGLAKRNHLPVFQKAEISRCSLKGNTLLTFRSNTRILSSVKIVSHLRWLKYKDENATRVNLNSNQVIFAAHYASNWRKN